MEFADVVRKRRMVRDYDPDRPVPPDIRERLLEHALHAPSAGFSQGWGFLVLESPTERERFWRGATPPTQGGQQGVGNKGTAPPVVGAPPPKDAHLPPDPPPPQGGARPAGSPAPAPHRVG